MDRLVVDGILIATLPMLIVAIAPLFGIPERLHARRVLGLCFGLTGVIALLGISGIALAPAVLSALNPFAALAYMLHAGFGTSFAMFDMW